MTASEVKPAASTITWSAHPARQRPGAAVMASAVIVILAAAVAWFGGSPPQYWWSVLGGVVLMMALNRFFFPSQFTIDDEGITARHPMRRKRLLWKDVRRFLHDEHGGYLSTRARASRFDAYRGMHLLFGEEDGQRIVQVIENKVRSIRDFLEDSSDPASAGSGYSMGAKGGAL